MTSGRAWGRRPTLAANWAFDCIINAKLCRLHPGPGFTSFFRSLAAPDGPWSLIAPPPGWPDAPRYAGGALGDVHRRLYDDDGVTPLPAADTVLETLKQIRAAGKHLEITTLVIPTLNDDPVVFAKQIDWLADELGPDTILHLSRYFPHYRCTIEQTPRKTLDQLQEIAMKRLRHVHLGNVW